MSVDESRLTGAGYAITLTVRTAPRTAAEWHRIRRAFVERLRRLGLMRLVWTVEVQKRRVPHLHCTAYLADEGLEDAIRDAWLAVARSWGVKGGGQHVVPLEDDGGWSAYLISHSFRSVHHYQRNPARFPVGWIKEGSLGRMWGSIGDWSMIDEPDEWKLNSREWFIWRRRVRAHAIARARVWVEEARRRAAEACQRPEAWETVYTRAERHALWLCVSEGVGEPPVGRMRPRGAEWERYREARRVLVRARRFLRDPHPKRSRVRGCTSWGASERLLAGIDVWQDLPDRSDAGEVNTY